MIIKFVPIFYETQDTIATFNGVPFILIFSEETIQYSRTFAPQVQTSWNQAHSATIYLNFQ
jgi:hypothetical protein